MKNDATNNDRENELAAIALRSLIGRLIAQEIPPGAKLSQRKLAALLGMSYQPVSIALKRLEQEGIIISIPRRGSQVAKLSLREMWDAVQGRISVEQRAIQLACRYASDEELEALAPLAEAADVNTEDSLDRDDRFHRALTACSHSQLLTRTMRELHFFRIKMLLCPEWSRLVSSFWLPPAAAIGQKCPHFGHVKLLELVRRRDERRAMDDLDGHICPRPIYRLIFPDGEKNSIANALSQP